MHIAKQNIDKLIKTIDIIRRAGKKHIHKKIAVCCGCNYYIFLSLQILRANIKKGYYNIGNGYVVANTHVPIDFSESAGTIMDIYRIMHEYDEAGMLEDQSIIF